MGFDVDRFEEEVNEGLLCCICHDVLEDAVQAPCEHAFCTACIQAWLLEDNSCPVDRQILLSSELTQLHRYMRNDLNSLLIRCSNWEHGCRERLSLEAVAHHESGCQHQPVKCPACKTSLSRGQLQQHSQICQMRGSGLVPAEDVARMLEEMRLRVEALKDEFAAKLQEQKVELDLRLDAQRRHLVQRENGVQEQLEEMKRLCARQSEEMKRLAQQEKKTRAELHKMSQEKLELLAILQQSTRYAMQHQQQQPQHPLYQPMQYQHQQQQHLGRLPEKVTDL